MGEAIISMLFPYHHQFEALEKDGMQVSLKVLQ
jgi:hypothetical protein